MASEYVKSKARVTLTPGDSVRIAREMLGWSQNELAKHTRIPQSTLSGIESDRISLGVERAKKLAIALKVHPAVLLFPQWDLDQSGALVRIGGVVIRAGLEPATYGLEGRCSIQLSYRTRCVFRDYVLAVLVVIFKQREAAIDESLQSVRAQSQLVELAPERTLPGFFLAVLTNQLQNLKP
jgi:transcriptional regulator with XRE-family HTH domain